MCDLLGVSEQVPQSKERGVVVVPQWAPMFWPDPSSSCSIIRNNDYVPDVLSTLECGALW